MMTRPLGGQMDPNSLHPDYHSITIKTRLYLLHFAKRWNGILCILTFFFTKKRKLPGISVYQSGIFL